MPSVPSVLGGLGDCLPWAYGTGGAWPHNGVERSGKVLRRLAFGARPERRTVFSLNNHGSELKRSADYGVGMLPVGFPGAAFSAWWERFTAGVPFWKNGLVPSHNVKKVTVWPNSEIATLLGEDVKETVPEFVWETGYSVNVVEASDTSIAGVTITIDDVDTTDSDAAILATEASYKTTLEAAQWVIDDSGYDTVGFFATSPLEEIQVQFFYEDGAFNIYVYRGVDLDIWEKAEGWPAAAVAAVSTSTDVVPTPDGTVFSSHVVSINDGKETGLIVRVRVDDFEAAKTTYAAKLVEAGFVKDGDTDTYLSADGLAKVTISAAQPSSLGYKYLYVQVTNVYVIAPGTFDFSLTTQRSEFSVSKAVYTSGLATLTIEKGASTSNVGGDGQAFMPDTDGNARFYTSQILTIAVDATVSVTSVVFTVTTAKSGAANLVKSTIVGATAAASEDNTVVTLTPEANTTQITITLAGQVRVTSLVVTYAKN